MAEPRFVRVLVSENPCPDCLYIVAMQDPRGYTMDEIIARGWLPGSGITVCGSNDQCQLVTVDYVNSSDDVDIRDRQIRFVKSGEIAPVPGVVEDFYDLLYEAQKQALITSSIQEQLFTAESVARQVEILMQLLGKAVNKKP